MTRYSQAKIQQLRERVSELSSVHASLGDFPRGNMLHGSHVGWSSCQCSLARLLREYSEKIEKLMARRQVHRRRP